MKWTMLLSILKPNYDRLQKLANKYSIDDELWLRKESDN